MTPPPVLADLRALVTQRMAGLHAALLDQADDALFDLASRSSANRDQQDFLDAMRELRRERSTISQRLRSAVQADFDGQEQSEEDAETLSDELSLIAIDDLELQLASDRLAATLERQYGRQLHGLARAMQRLTGVERPPLSPLALAQSLAKALSPLQVPLTGQLVILKLFERQLGSELGGLLEQLQGKLAEHGIEVEQAVGPPRVIRQASRRAEPPSSDEDSASADSEESTQDQPSAGDGAETAEPSSAASNAAGQASSSGSVVLLHALRDMFSSYFSGSSEHEQAAAPAGDATHRGLPDRSRLGASESGAAAGSASRARAPGDIQSMPAPVAAEQVLAALAYMQQTPPPGLFRAVDDRNAELGDLLKFELLHCARETLGLSIAGGLRRADAQGLTLVGMLFDVLLDQGDFSDAIRRQLISVSVPYAKVALLDQQMFAHRTHPARRLLNMLADACDGNRGESRTERELLMRVDAVTKRLNKEFDRDIQLFVELEQRFSKVMEQRRQRSHLTERRTAESLKGRERLEDARMTASLEVSSLMGGHQVPEAIEHFVRRDWSHHLAMVLLREGEASEAFRRARRVGIDLMIAVHACAQGAAVPSNLEAKLKPVCQSTGRHGAGEIIQALQALRSGAACISQQPPAEAIADNQDTQQSIQRRLQALRGPTPAASPASDLKVAPPTLKPLPSTGSAVPGQSAARRPAPANAAALDELPVAEEIDAALSESGFEIVEAPAARVAGSPEISGDLILQIDATQVSPADVERINGLKPGQWVDLVDAEGVHHAAKLSWVSPISQRILFVNRSGARLCLLTPPEAAALITQGKLRPHSADQAFDRALVNVLERIRENAEYANPPP